MKAKAGVPFRVSRFSYQSKSSDSGMSTTSAATLAAVNQSRYFPARAPGVAQ